MLVLKRLKGGVKVIHQDFRGSDFWKYGDSEFIAGNGFVLRSSSVPEVIMQDEDDYGPQFGLYVRGDHERCDNLTARWGDEGEEMINRWLRLCCEAVRQYNKERYAPSV